MESGARGLREEVTRGAWVGGRFAVLDESDGRAGDVIFIQLLGNGAGGEYSNLLWGGRRADVADVQLAIALYSFSPARQVCNTPGCKSRDMFPSFIQSLKSR